MNAKKLSTDIFKLVLPIFVLLLFGTATANAQIVPAEITASLNKLYKGWKPAPGFCDGKKWALTGDFDGDGLQDYVVRVKTGKTAKQMKLHLVAFINAGDGNYPVAHISDEFYTSDLLRSTFAVMKKGEQVSFGEGEGETITLKTDAATQYICETDAAIIYIYENERFKNIVEE